MLKDVIRSTNSDKIHEEYALDAVKNDLSNWVGRGTYPGRIDARVVETNERDRCVVGTLGLFLTVKQKQFRRRVFFILDPGKANMKKRAKRDAAVLKKLSEALDVAPLTGPNDWARFIGSLCAIQSCRAPVLFAIRGEEHFGMPLEVFDIKQRKTIADHLVEDHENDEAAAGTHLQSLLLETAIVDFREITRPLVNLRAREGTVAAEERAWLQYRRDRARGVHRKKIQTAVRALHRFMSTKSFPYPALSVWPGDLHSGVHVADVLRLVGHLPNQWRVVVEEGLETGALMFREQSEEQPEIALVLANPDWQGNFRITVIYGEMGGDRSVCRKIMDKNYPEVLPDPARWEGSSR